jgi:aldehyde:ferredoxin oxidoreductase
MTFSFCNKILRIDLTERTVTHEESGEHIYREYMGGHALICYYLLKETPAHVDPLGPKNKLIFATGVLTGIPVAGCGRNSIGACSPLTGTIASSEVGGFWGAQLKRSGFDAIIIEGQADSPVYVWINNDNVEIRDASQLWGLENLEAHRLICEEVQQNRASIAQIGPAGENQVLYANIMADLTHSAGRGGIGAVMGSKNLKAIAVYGTNKVPVHDDNGVKEVARWVVENYKSLAGNLAVWGTGGSVQGYNSMKVLPVRNFRDGWLLNAEEAHPREIMKQIGQKMDGCFACPIRCKKVVEMETPYHVDPAYGGPEYETIGAIGTSCCIHDIAIIAKASERLNALGMDSISCGHTIAWAMEAYEKGILTADMNAGTPITYGNGEVLLDLIDKIAKRQGIGELLALGSKKAAENLGHNSIDFAMQVKGMEIPLHDPRSQHGLGLGYALSHTGADHNHNIFDIDYSDLNNVPDLQAMGIQENMNPLSLDARKIRAYAYGVLRPNLNNIIGFCNFVPINDERILALVRACTGWNCSHWEIMKVAERGLTMARAYNAREGFSIKDDTLPNRFFTPINAKDSISKPICKEELSKGVRLYYEMMGWNPETGFPEFAKFEELGLGWINKVL